MMEFMRSGDLLQELDNLKGKSDWILILEERCDCGEIVKHWDAGNYHRRCIIVPFQNNIAVTYSSTCILDESTICSECGSRVKEHDRHEHHSEDQFQEVIKFAVQWIGEGWAEVVLDDMVRVYEIRWELQDTGGESQ